MSNSHGINPEFMDLSADPGTTRLTAWLETKTVWHPKGV